MNVLELFAGIGGIGLGLERAGMTVVGQVEIDPYCQRVLAKHWPEVPRHDDVRTCIDWWRSGPRPVIDLIAGGFPCQDISTAGKRAGIIDGERSSLWSHMAATIGALRPRYVLVENVSALLVRGLDVVLADLAACGYDAEWDCIPASAVGAPHRRDRVWLVAYPSRNAQAGTASATGSVRQRTRSSGESGRPQHVPDSQRDPVRVESVPIFRGRGPAITRSDGKAQPLADTHGEGQSQPGRSYVEVGRWSGDSSGESGSRGLAYPDSQPSIRSAVTRPERNPWAAEPDVGRVAHGVPARVDRLRALGNAVVPQVAEHVGRLILAADQRSVA